MLFSDDCGSCGGGAPAADDSGDSAAPTEGNDNPEDAPTGM